VLGVCALIVNHHHRFNDDDDYLYQISGDYPHIIINVLVTFYLFIVVIHLLYLTHGHTSS